MSRLTAALALSSLALAAALSGCGQTGELQRPPPLFGSAKAAAPADQTDRQDASQPVRTIDPRSRNLDPAPPRVNPLLGQSPDPLGPAPQGAMGNPYADPR